MGATINMVQVKSDAVEAVKAMLVAEKKWLVDGMAQGYLADSALDGLTMDVARSTVNALGFDRNFPAVIVRVEDDMDIQDFIATPTGAGFSISHDVRFRKGL